MSAPLSYEVRLPDNFDPELKYPVIFALHGMGANEQNMLSLLEDINKDFIVIAIRGNLPQGNGYSYFYIQSIGNPERELFDQAVQQLEQFIRYATDKYPIDPSKRYLLGFSQGAILSMTLALTMGEQIKGIVALNGYIPTFVQAEYPIKPIPNMSVFISHGEHDPIFPLQRGDANYEYFRKASDHVAYKVYATGHEVSGANIQDFTKWLRQNHSTHTNERGV